VLPSLYAVFHSGFFVSDDGDWMIIRFSAFYQTFADGQFPVRYLERLNFNYGYPVANFLYPGFLYLGVPFRIIGFDSVQVVKILMSLFMLGGAVGIFFWLRKFFNSYSALIGSVVYTYSPYHLFNLYKRGSVGELMGLSIFPFVLWMIERKSIFFVALGIFLVLLSHNTLALLFILFVLLYSLMRRRLGWVIRPILIGGLSSSFFTIPAVFDLKFTKFLSTKVSNPLENFAQFYLFGFGTIVILALAIVVFVLVYFKKRMSEKVYLSLFFAGLTIFLLFLAHPFSVFLWKISPSSWIQFPFRLLSITLVSVAFLSSYVTYSLFPKFRFLLGALLLLVVIGFSLGNALPREYSFHEIGYYETNESLTTTHNEYMPIGVKKEPSARPEKLVEVSDGEISIHRLNKNSHKIMFDVDAKTNGSVRVNKVYFPGWNYRVDGDRKKLPFVKDDGLMYIPILRGENSIILSFDETPLRTIANALSIVGFVILISIPVRYLISKYIK
jgi:hypothetical protein